MEYYSAYELLSDYIISDKMGLDNIRSVLNVLDNPQKKLKFIHVAGTNGKGSTCAYLNSILIESGYKVGMYTSPSMEHFNDRIRINNNPISDQELTDYAKIIDDKLRDTPYKATEFEMFTVLAFEYFHQARCDIVILEVGIGGLLDATNIIDNSLISVITKVDLDHIEVLGSTIEEIARQKAGIIKDESITVVYPKQEKVLEIVNETATSKKTKVIVPKVEEMEYLGYDNEYQKYRYKSYQNIELGILGKNQIMNSLVAIEIAEALNNCGFIVSKENIIEGLKKTKWPGRFEIMCNNPLVVIDGAHNTNGISSLKENLNQYFPDKKVIAIMGVLADKDYSGMLDIIDEKVEEYYTVTVNSDRALSNTELAQLIENKYSKKVSVISDINDSTNMIGKYSDEYIYCYFGSLYFISDVRVILQKRCK